MTTTRHRQHRAVQDDVHVQLAARLTARDRWVIRMLAEHRVLTTAQLDELAFTGPRQHTTPHPTPPSAASPGGRSGPRAAQSRLRVLAELGVIDRFRPPSATGTGSTPQHWVTTALSFTVLAAEDGLPQPSSPRRPTARPAAARTEEFTGRAVSGARGVALAHNQQLAHQLGTNACLVALTTAQPHPQLQGSRGVGQVRLWWGQARAGRHLSPARPDAYAVWADDPTTRPPTPGRIPAPSTPAALAFALEYDTGTETLHQVAGKLAGYHALALATMITTPVLFWLPTPRREANVRGALAETLAALPVPQLVPIATAYPHPELPGQGWHPHAPVWTLLCLDPAPTPYRPLPHSSSYHPRQRLEQRLSLAELAAGIDQPHHAHHAHQGVGHPGTSDLLHTGQVEAFQVTHGVHPPIPTDPFGSDLAADLASHNDDPGDTRGRGFGPSAPWRPPSPIAPLPADTRFARTTPIGR